MAESEHNNGIEPAPRGKRAAESPGLMALLAAFFASVGALPDRLWRRIRRIGPRVRALRRHGGL